MINIVSTAILKMALQNSYNNMKYKNFLGPDNITSETINVLEEYGIKQVTRLLTTKYVKFTAVT